MEQRRQLWNQNENETSIYGRSMSIHWRNVKHFRNVTFDEFFSNSIRRYMKRYYEDNYVYFIMNGFPILLRISLQLLKVASRVLTFCEKSERNRIKTRSSTLTSSEYCILASLQCEYSILAVQ